jgi:hypothetical protein
MPKYERAAKPAASPKKPAIRPQCTRIVSAITSGFDASVSFTVPPPPQEAVSQDAFALPEGVSLLDIQFDQCLWPNDGAGDSFRFCGRKSSRRPWGSKGESSCPYCDDHADMAGARGRRRHERDCNPTPSARCIIVRRDKFVIASVQAAEEGGCR